MIPFSKTNRHKKLGPLWVASRRFALRQKSKIRLIDDLSEYGPNFAVGISEKIDLGGIDEVVCMIKAWIKATAAN